MLYRDVAFKAYAYLFMTVWEGEKARQAMPESEGTEALYQAVRTTHTSLLEWADELPQVMVRNSRSLPPVLDLQFVVPPLLIPCWSGFGY